MKLPAFLKSVDQYTVTMTHKQLEGFVHELARTLPEADRDDFLDKLKHFSGENKPEMVPADDGRAEIINEIATLIPRLEQIREGDLEMEGNYDEDWNDWDDYSDIKPSISLTPPSVGKQCLSFRRKMNKRLF